MDIQTETQRAVVEELQERLVYHARLIAMQQQGRMTAVGIKNIAIHVLASEIGYGNG